MLARFALWRCLLLSAALLLVGGVHAQLPAGQCVAMGAAPLSQCDKVVDYLVFLPQNYTLALLDEAAANSTSFFFLGLTTPPCSDAALRFICAEAYRRCYPIPVAPGVSIAIPSSTCFASCYRFSEECEDQLAQYDFITLPDCNEENPILMQSEYPLNGWYIPLVPGTPPAFFPCNNPFIVTPYDTVPFATCEPFQGAPLSGCDTVVDWDVYVPYGFTQSVLDQLAAESTAAMRAGIVHSDCQAAGMAFICSEAFRQCSYGEVSADPFLEVLLPKNTCFSTCEDFNEECEADFNKLGLPLQDCRSVSPTSGLSNFPPQKLDYNIGTEVITVPCQAPVFTINGKFTFIPYATCEKLRPTTISQCSESGALDDQTTVYLEEGTTQAMLDQEAYDSTFSVLYPNDFVPQVCTDATFHFACTGIFLECEEVELESLPGAKVILPVPPCRDLCEEVGTACGQTLRSAGKEPPNCNERTDSGLPLFPEEYFYLYLGDQAIQYECDPGSDSEITVDKDCPGDFEKDGDTCDLPCPIPVYSDDRYLAMKICMSYGAGVTLVSSLFLIATYVLDKERRKFPVNMPMWISVAGLGLSIGILLGTIFGYDKVICDWDGVCKAQAAILVYFQFSLASWMMILVFNIALTMVLQIKFRKVMSNKQKIVLQLIYQVVGWGIGIPPVVVALSVDKMGPVIPTIICFISVDPDGWPLIGIYSIPIFVIIILTVTFTLFVIIGIWVLVVRLEKGGRMKFINALLEQKRIFLFLVVFLYVFLYNIEESIRASANYDSNVEDVTEWSECVFAEGDDSDCELDAPNLIYSLSLLFVINVSLQGFFINAIFLTTAQTFRFWRDRFLNLIQGKGFYGDQDEETLVSHKSFQSNTG